MLTSRSILGLRQRGAQADLESRLVVSPANMPDLPPDQTQVLLSSSEMPGTPLDKPSVHTASDGGWL